MSLSSKTIETFAVSAVKESVALCSLAEPYINEGDKEPSLDGNIYIYNDEENHKKDQIAGRIPVQVKGTTSGKVKSRLSYSMERSDLENFLKAGGAMLFIVYIEGAGKTKTIYYAELPPIKLRILLKPSKNQKSKNISLKPFPKGQDDKSNIFLNFLQACKLQASFAFAELPTLDELREKGVLEGITIPISGMRTTNPQDILLNNEVYVYAKIKGSAIPQPLEEIPEHFTTYERIDSKISIDDKLYYNSIGVTKNATDTTYTLGESFKGNFHNGNPPCNISYKNSPKLRTLVVDLDFFLTFFEKGYFNLNDTKMPFDYSNVSFSQSDFDEQKKYCLC